LRSGTGVVEGERATGSPWSEANRALVTAMFTKIGVSVNLFEMLD